jgi:hypothetical protein
MAYLLGAGTWSPPKDWGASNRMVLESQIRTGSGRQAKAALRNLAIGIVGTAASPPGPRRG